ncbi:minor capsid protein [Paenibacillus melissococcoides]|uniref:Minor capsid protein n=2 Tax=Paenibacillus TaxID=44249 RepID=A0ABN8UCB5_9BACL|nr:phage minor head protein [Paenibacillus melissococcoides]MEB9892057.1 phage minor head protein [Bacillus cereus]CAH8248792.1 minor capsid protein [Paenibacillus melissococcoides]CAH8249591.1 minor capsid protein [Paenibacillus melissococcoides]CAH8249714.1 minor capsid protein [Paenibacillus melissococcoides]CAH8249837.1 minor capsid protein [Paenibacillus melissococcoides]
MREWIELLTTPGFVFEEAVAFFGDKLPMKESEFYQLAEEYRAQAFTISGYSKIQLLRKFHGELLKAIDEGTTLGKFRERMNDWLEQRGYEGVTNYQADNIFRTNVQTAYQVGHWKQMTAPETLRLRPYWQYDAVQDKRTRPSHLAMHGRVFRADDPIWNTWYPPNGFRCRCTVRTLSERQVRERGLKVETEPPVSAQLNGQHVNIMPDPSFSNNPAKHAFDPDVSSYPKSLKKAFENREKRKSKE